MKELDIKNLSRGHWINADTTVRKKKKVIKKEVIGLIVH